MSERVFQVKRKITIEGEKPDEMQTTSTPQGPATTIAAVIFVGLVLVTFLLSLIGAFK